MPFHVPRLLLTLSERFPILWAPQCRASASRLTLQDRPGFCSRRESRKGNAKEFSTLTLFLLNNSSEENYRTWDLARTSVSRGSTPLVRFIHVRMVCKLD